MPACPPHPTAHLVAVPGGSWESGPNGTPLHGSSAKGSVVPAEKVVSVAEERRANQEFSHLDPPTSPTPHEATSLLNRDRVFLLADGPAPHQATKTGHLGPQAAPETPRRALLLGPHPEPSTWYAW